MPRSFAIRNNHLLNALVLLAFLLTGTQYGMLAAAALPEPITITHTDDDNELTASCFPANSDATLVFLPSVYASMTDQEAYAGEIAANGLASCITHALTDLFLPMKTGSYNDIPATAMLGLLTGIRQKTGKPLYFVAHGSGNRLAVRLAALALEKYSADALPLNGLIMLSPNLLDHTPEPGEAPEYMPQLASKMLPMYIFQPFYSPHHYHLDTLLTHIRAAGTKVSFQRIPSVRDGYALREDRSPREQQLREQGATLFQQAIQQLEQ